MLHTYKPNQICNQNSIYVSVSQYFFLNTEGFVHANTSDNLIIHIVCKYLWWLLYVPIRHFSFCFHTLIYIWTANQSALFHRSEPDMRWSVETPNNLSRQTDWWPYTAQWATINLVCPDLYIGRHKQDIFFKIHVNRKLQQTFFYSMMINFQLNEILSRGGVSFLSPSSNPSPAGNWRLQVLG